MILSNTFPIRHVLALHPGTPRGDLFLSRLKEEGFIHLELPRRIGDIWFAYVGDATMDQIDCKLSRLVEGELQRIPIYVDALGSLPPSIQTPIKEQLAPMKEPSRG